MAVAQSGESGPRLSHVHRRQRLIDLDTKVATGDHDRSAMGPELAGAPGDGGRRGLVLSGQAALAASVDHDLSALADRCRAVGFVFAAAGRDRRPVYFVAQTRAWSRSCFFVFAYFLVALLPVLGLVDNPIFRYSLVFDHFQYLASMGPLALAGAGLARFADFVIPKKPWLQSTLCAGLLLVLGMSSWQRTWIYESQETLWTETLAKNPDCWLGYNNLGSYSFSTGAVRRGRWPNFKMPWKSIPTLPKPTTTWAALFSKGGTGRGRLPNSKRPWKSTPTWRRPTTTSAVFSYKRGGE